MVHPSTAGVGRLVAVTAASWLLIPGCIPPSTPPPDDGRCRADAECDDGVFCNGEETCDADGTCQPGIRCISDECPDCACSELLRICTVISRCSNASDCDDERFCNGPEACVNGACKPGTPVVCEDGSCDEEQDACVVPGCADGVECDDGAFCNGVETCDAETGQCVPGAPPCEPIDCLDGGDPAAACDEASDACLKACVLGEPCDDGLFCNGFEACDGCACQPGVPPCAEGACDEESDTCVGG